jgi:p-hydroxybenzoate 3-monooxygenase
MTSMLHTVDDDPFARRLQTAQLAAVVSQPAAATNFAQNYVGLPFDGRPA